MRIRYLIVALGAGFGQHPAWAYQSPVSAYIQQAFGNLPQTNCSGTIGAYTCTVPVIIVANTLHLPGSSGFSSPVSGSIRYCSASAQFKGGPIFGFSAFGRQLRSETSPAFADQNISCQLDFNLNYNSMKFEGPAKGKVVPTVTYDLAVVNGMLVGTTPGFTAVIVFGTPSAAPVRHP